MGEGSECYNISKCDTSETHKHNNSQSHGHGRHSKIVHKCEPLESSQSVQGSRSKIM